MTIGERIAEYRKARGVTQETLAQALGVTNQAVSKWESDQCCPDVMLLPEIADFFGVTLDGLFGRAVTAAAPDMAEEGDADDTLRVALLCGGRVVERHELCKKVEISWDGPVRDLSSDFSVSCGDVQGSVNAGSDVTCDGVGGSVNAGSDVTCDSVGGSVTAGGDVTCDDVGGSVNAGGDVTCDNVGDSVRTGGDVPCCGGRINLHADDDGFSFYTAD